MIIVKLKNRFHKCSSKTLREINAGRNITRINGWNGFFKRNTWEVAGDLNEIASYCFKMHCKKRSSSLPMKPGFISARIISMIINEAFYAKGENISTENEIDIAMKLGTKLSIRALRMGTGDRHK